LEFKNMISLQQLRRFFLGMSLAVILATATAFGFGSANSWAATSLTQLGSQPQTQILAMNRAETITKDIKGKAQEVMDKMSGDPKDRSMVKGKQLESKTRTATDVSIDNPSYQPGGKTKEAEKQSRESSKGIKAEVNEALDKNK
jgi:uncharacterized protein YjbJ (UPF0337 family)